MIDVRLNGAHPRICEFLNHVAISGTYIAYGQTGNHSLFFYLEATPFGSKITRNLLHLATKFIVNCPK